MSLTMGFETVKGVRSRRQKAPMVSAVGVEIQPAHIGIDIIIANRNREFFDVLGDYDAGLASFGVPRRLIVVGVLRGKIACA